MMCRPKTPLIRTWRFWRISPVVAATLAVALVGGGLFIQDMPRRALDHNLKLLFKMAMLRDDLVRQARVLDADNPLQAKEPVPTRVVSNIMVNCASARQMTIGLTQHVRYPAVAKYVGETAGACAEMTRLAESRSFSRGQLRVFARNQVARHDPARDEAMDVFHRFAKLGVATGPEEWQKAQPKLTSSLQEWGKPTP